MFPRQRAANSKTGSLTSVMSSRNFARDEAKFTPRPSHCFNFRRTVRLFACCCCSVAFFLFSFRSNRSIHSKDCELYYGPYKGTQYTTTATVKSKCLVESPFVKVQQHHVQLESNVVIEDWIWIDYHDRINVLVEVSPDNFYILKQTKYALNDQSSWSIIGGIIEPNERPEQAAKREVREEVNVDCDEWVSLGRYRTDVNRGMGWTNTYLARQCSALSASSDNTKKIVADQVAGPDTERQELKTLSLQDLRQGVLSGKFMEIQWTATVAIALLHIDAKVDSL
jgi:ADP-ribose pyrophosphatase